MKAINWDDCLKNLKSIIKDQEFNTWIRPLHVEISDNQLKILAPNRFVQDWVRRNYLQMINEILATNYPDENINTTLEIGSKTQALEEIKSSNKSKKSVHKSVDNFVDKELLSKYGNLLNRTFTLENFVKGKSNEFAFAAATQAADRPGDAYNPLLIYGDVGLGKTHLMNAVGNSILKRNAQSKVLYLHSERYVANMIKALQNNQIEEFKRFYQSVDVLLIDDIQFFAGKDRSQEEFFHTFNALLEGKKQIVLTCDRYPKEIEGLEQRLKSRFGWGLTVAIEPPELETRVAILMNKAEQAKVELPNESAFFIAKRIRSNVRELEGALKRVIANSEFTGKPITVDFVKEALKDLIAVQDKLVTIDNIIKTVAEYYKIKVAELLSKRRNRAVSRPRQLAMAMAKELTNRSLPEIGDAFGGRDHTTVLHATRKIKELLDSNADIREDYTNLLRILTS